jgi:hypothetical protein
LEFSNAAGPTRARLVQPARKSAPEVRVGDYWRIWLWFPVPGGQNAPQVEVTKRQQKRRRPPLRGSRRRWWERRGLSVEINTPY